jgi:hypothetical protein
MNVSNEGRRQHIATMRANFAIANMRPDAEDLALQKRYIEGMASLYDLMSYALAYAAKHAPSGSCSQT